MVALACGVIRAAWAAGPVYGPEVEARVEGLLGQMTLEEKLGMLGGVDGFYVEGVPRLGIPKLKMADGPMGVRNWGQATMYPATMALAATWDTELALRFGDAIGADSRARGVHISLAPGVNIYRSPLCGRNFEYMGEDPYLSGVMATEVVRGVQARNVAATVKHFACNNHETWRSDLSSDVDERTLREIYLPAFKRVVEEGQAGCVMSAYNLLNGTHCTENVFLNNTVLKGEWKFPGVLMSDWSATHTTLAAARGGLDLEMPAAVHFAPDKLKPLIESGELPQALIDEKVRRTLRLIESYGWVEGRQEDKSIPLDRPESAATALQVAREGIVLLKNEDGLLPLDRAKVRTVVVLGPNAGKLVTGQGSSKVNPFHSVGVTEGILAAAGKDKVVGIEWKSPDPARSDAFEGKVTMRAFKSPGDAEKHIICRTQELDQIAAEWDPKTPELSWNLADDAKPVVEFAGTIVPKTAETELVVQAQAAGLKVYIDGELVWNSAREAGASFVLPLEAGKGHALKVVAEARKKGLKFSARVGWAAKSSMLSADEIEAVKSADAVVACVGFNIVQAEGEGADRSYNLPGRQEELILEAARLNPKMVVLLNAGGSAATERWIDKVPAFLHIFYPGQEGGTAIAEILFGDISPTGKLPFSYEKRWEDCAAYPFYPRTTKPQNNPYTEGVLLGYRWFDTRNIAPLFPFGHGLTYTSFTLSDLHVERSGKDKVIVSADVKNTGGRPAAEVVQIYVGQPNPKLERPTRELKAFRRVSLLPGETRRVVMELGRDAFSYFDPARKVWVVDDAQFVVEVGTSSGDIRGKALVRYR